MPRPVLQTLLTGGPFNAAIVVVDTRSRDNNDWGNGLLCAKSALHFGGGPVVLGGSCV